ncbi:hypothetical protein G7B40_012050 [Aetokthonos hydrillicola Thurmond2011]|jgi:hypothetical protein|uniref:Uncharacterized protein n=1 Tax=Aetokthonos hydrillicola Thurmond2011 TaxID=2712845 RepID=A0AAP5M9Z9_9CYAN|nr:hypothetical protein [Aetokthonos hydrillicola]MBO3459079.1 hypothetical protein [Aetokthonos hydrillicola CCALA 1050]MBW4584747.1 hypothetical protein [Aetokthonos hydrillicola CCALA 1050]MDR9895293.1 hypothetical protein [Aetokthonos hydrillicola Thurmond2011]
MNCKYKDHPFPPCRFEQHPHNSNIYFCPHCRESYDVRDIGNQFPKWLLFSIVIIISLLVFNHRQSFQPSTNNSQANTHTQVK